MKKRFNCVEMMHLATKRSRFPCHCEHLIGFADGFKKELIWVARLRVLAKPCLPQFRNRVAKQSGILNQESQIASSSTPRNDPGAEGYRTKREPT
jgi:hypothetical protein